MNKITNFFTELMRQYLPDPFVFAILLTLLTMLLAILVERQAPSDMILSWGNGFWKLLSFTTQMAVILAMGYVLAGATIVDRFLDKIVSCVHSPHLAIIVATLVGAIGSYLNWGFGLVIGGIVAKKLAHNVRGVHYPLIIASAYSGFTLYGLGICNYTYFNIDRRSRITRADGYHFIERNDIFHPHAGYSTHCHNNFTYS